MTLGDIEYPHLDEIVFENRNKSYGAYLLRKTYNQHVSAAIFITGGICALLIGIPSLSGWMERGSMLPTIDKETIVRPTYPPEIISEVTLPPRSAAKASTATNLVPEVTEAAVPDVPKPEVVSPIQAVDGSDEGIPGDPDFGIAGGAGKGTEPLGVPAVEVKDIPLVFAEEMPEFPGGHSQLMKYLSKKLHYPLIAQQTETEGKVFVQFVVNRDGRITDVTIMKGVSKECDEEAIRVVKSMPNWKPGRQNGSTVSVKYVFPIVFKMGE